MKGETFKILELFAGIGAASKALENLGIEHEIVDAVEIDKYAVKAFNAIHGTNFVPQDICEWDKDIECDLIMHGSPCQDFSIAGRQAGGDKDSGTRSSLMYETLRIVEKLKPKYVIWENVKNLLSKKHRHNFDAYLEAMTKLGYANNYQVLNAKNYGVPQNRERVFTVSILGEGNFKFPEPIPLEKKLKDVLETEVEEKYYLTDAQVASFVASTKKAESKGNGFKFEPIERERERESCAHDCHKSRKQTDRQLYQGIIGRIEALNDLDIHKRVYGTDGPSPTICARHDSPKIIASRGRGENNVQHLEARKDGLTNTITTVQKDNYVAIKTANTLGYDLATSGDGVDLAYPDSKTRRGRVGHGVSKTLPTSDSQGVLDNFRIRKLTPRECYRLMGFDDASFDRASKVISQTQLYKTAGNSIVVQVLESILNNLLKKENYDEKKLD